MHRSNSFRRPCAAAGVATHLQDYLRDKGHPSFPLLDVRDGPQQKGKEFVTPGIWWRDYVFVGCNAARLLDGSLPLVEKRYEAEYGRIK